MPGTVDIHPIHYSSIFGKLGRERRVSNGDGLLGVWDWRLIKEIRDGIKYQGLCESMDIVGKMEQFVGYTPLLRIRKSLLKAFLGVVESIHYREKLLYALP